MVPQRKNLTGHACSRKQIYDFILMEPRLPDVDGFSIAKAIKNNDVYKNIPLIALTTYAMKGDKERILKAGFHGEGREVQELRLQEGVR